jgi:hypothetical protein
MKRLLLICTMTLAGCSAQENALVQSENYNTIPVARTFVHPINGYYTDDGFTPYSERSRTSAARD